MAADVMTLGGRAMTLAAAMRQNRYNGGMLVEYDEPANAAYLYLRPAPQRSLVEETVELADANLESHPPALDWINLDFDADGRLCGIEVLNADAVLPADVLAAAKRI